MVTSGDTGSERALASGFGLVLEIVRLIVNQQFPQLMPSLHPGELATCPQPIDSIDAMWVALGTLANNKKPASNGAEFVSLSAVSGERVSAPSGPPPVALGRGQGRATSRLLLG